MKVAEKRDRVVEDLIGKRERIEKREKEESVVLSGGASRQKRRLPNGRVEIARE